MAALPHSPQLPYYERLDNHFHNRDRVYLAWCPSERAFAVGILANLWGMVVFRTSLLHKIHQAKSERSFCLETCLVIYGDSFVPSQITQNTIDKGLSG
jgi:hypothetical protein